MWNNKFHAVFIDKIFNLHSHFKLNLINPRNFYMIIFKFHLNFVYEYKLIHFILMLNFYVTKKSSFMNFKFLIMIICAHPIFIFIDIFINFLFISKTLPGWCLYFIQRYEGFIWCCDVLKCIHHLVNIGKNIKKASEHIFQAVLKS